MTILIYIDAENFPGSSEGILNGLKRLYGNSALTDRTFAMHTAVTKSSLQWKQYTNWRNACTKFGFTLGNTPHVPTKKNASDFALIGKIVEDVLRTTENQRQHLRLVMISGDSDFYPIIKALKVVVKEVIVVGKNSLSDMTECYRNCARFMTLQQLIGNAPKKNIEYARQMISDCLSKNNKDILMNVGDIEALLEDNDHTYWPMDFDCSTTSELLEKLGVNLGDQSLSVHQLLQTLSHPKPPKQQPQNNARQPNQNNNNANQPNNPFQNRQGKNKNQKKNNQQENEMDAELIQPAFNQAPVHPPNGRKKRPQLRGNRNLIPVLVEPKPDTPPRCCSKPSDSLPQIPNPKLKKFRPESMLK
ncbi:hypothetical protein GEMRC1_010610 [Eukaryota sp. GEM-RC1]